MYNIIHCDWLIVEARFFYYVHEHYEQSSPMLGHLPKNKQKMLTIAILFVTCQELYLENMALGHTCLVYLKSLVTTAVIISNTVSLPVASGRCCQC